MFLCDKELENRAQWEGRGFILPRYDRNAVRQRTKAEPVWLHLGAGNIFRAFPAVLQQKLLDEGLYDKGIIVAEGYDYEIIDAAYTAHDNLSVSVTLKADGSIDKTVVASVVESLKMDAGGMERLREIFAAPSLLILSLTITEKGYNLTKGDASLLPDVEADFFAGPSSPVSYMGKLASLCYHRYINCAAPLSLVSMDNCSHNGDRLYEAVWRFASEWAAKGFAETGFLKYVENPSCLAFPWSMIDKITPRPDQGVASVLAASGLEGVEGAVTSKNTYIAPFVNAEESEYLVIEDAFPNGRPPLEKAGVMITDRETVDKTEKMKVCTCLNPLHTGLAVFGCLLSYTRVSDEMKDPVLYKLVNQVAAEGLPVVVDPKIMSPAEFVNTVINVRFPNPFMPDTPQRIATDTSQKVSIRFGETLKAYINSGAGENSPPLQTGDLRAIPLVLAGWCRYLTGINDDGAVFELSPDPMLAKLAPVFKSLSLGEAADYTDVLFPLLSDETVFGVDLFAAGVGNRVVEYFSSMMEGPGAVRKTLEAALR